MPAKAAGERLEALVCWQEAEQDPATSAAAMLSIKTLTDGWLPAERPQRWHFCPTLAPTSAGKWERARWRAWLKELERSYSADC